MTDDTNIIMSDEAHFYLSGFVNKQNCHYWSVAKLRDVHECPRRSRVTMWCGVTNHGIIYPYFFEQDGETATVNSDVKKLPKTSDNFLSKQAIQEGSQSSIPLYKIQMYGICLKINNLRSQIKFSCGFYQH